MRVEIYLDLFKEVSKRDALNLVKRILPQDSICGIICSERIADSALLQKLNKDNKIKIIKQPGSTKQLLRLLKENQDILVSNRLEEFIGYGKSALKNYKGSLFIEANYISDYLKDTIQKYVNQRRIRWISNHRMLGISFAPEQLIYRIRKEEDIPFFTSALDRGISSIILSTAWFKDVNKTLHLLKGIASSFEVRKLYFDYSVEELSELWSHRLRILVKRNLKSGHYLRKDDIYFEEGTVGISADYHKLVIGKELRYDVKKQTPITFGLINC